MDSSGLTAEETWISACAISRQGQRTGRPDVQMMGAAGRNYPQCLLALVHPAAGRKKQPRAQTSYLPFRMFAFTSRIAKYWHFGQSQSRQCTLGGMKTLCTIKQFVYWIVLYFLSELTILFPLLCLRASFWVLVHFRNHKSLLVIIWYVIGGDSAVVKGWILTSCQPQSITSLRSNSAISKYMFQNSSDM